MRLAHQLGCLLLAVGLQALLIGLAVHHLEGKEEESAEEERPPAKGAAASAPPPAIASPAPRPH